MISIVQTVGVFEISYGAMWLLLLVNSVLLLLLYRHFGLMSMETFEGVQRDGLSIGDEAPLIQGVTGSGESLTLHPGAARPAFVLFAAPECAPCKAVAPHVNRLELATRDGIDLDVAVVAAGDQAVASRVAENFEASFPTIADDGLGAFEAYRVRVTPFAFVVGEDRRVRAKGLCGDALRLRELLRAAGLSEAAAVMENEIEEYSSKTSAAAVLEERGATV